MTHHLRCQQESLIAKFKKKRQKEYNKKMPKHLECDYTGKMSRPQFKNGSNLRVIHNILEDD